MSGRKAKGFFLFAAISMFLISLMFVHASFKEKNSMPSLEEKRKSVKELELTDLCLFTDARYTRHPSMADLSTPFQDHPMSLEHFPSGTVMVPPRHIYRYGMD